MIAISFEIAIEIMKENKKEARKPLFSFYDESYQ
jgi:hypothetical protein